MRSANGPHARERHSVYNVSRLLHLYALTEILMFDFSLNFLQVFIILQARGRDSAYRPEPISVGIFMGMFADILKNRCGLPQDSREVMPTGGDVHVRRQYSQLNHHTLWMRHGFPHESLSFGRFTSRKAKKGFTRAGPTANPFNVSLVDTFLNFWACRCELGVKYE